MVMLWNVYKKIRAFNFNTFSVQQATFGGQQNSRMIQVGGGAAMALTTGKRERIEVSVTHRHVGMANGKTHTGGFVVAGEF